MKKVTTVLLLAIISINVFSQDTLKVRKHSFGSFIGIGLPVGAFGSTNGDNSESGFAKTGFGGIINYDYNFNKYFGLSIVISNSYNSFNENELEYYFTSSSPTLLWDVSSDGYSQTSMMYGGIFSLPIKNETLILNSKFLFGFMSVNSPQSMVYAEDTYGNNFLITKYEAKTLTTSGCIGMGARFNINERLAFSLSYDFIFANPEFNVLQETVSSFSGYEYSDIVFEQKINVYLMTVGIVGKF